MNAQKTFLKGHRAQRYGVEITEDEVMLYED